MSSNFEFIKIPSFRSILLEINNYISEINKIKQLSDSSNYKDEKIFYSNIDYITPILDNIGAFLQNNKFLPELSVNNQVISLNNFYVPIYKKVRNSDGNIEKRRITKIKNKFKVLTIHTSIQNETYSLVDIDYSLTKTEINTHLLLCYQYLLTYSNNLNIVISTFETKYLDMIINNVDIKNTNFKKSITNLKTTINDIIQNNTNNIDVMNNAITLIYKLHFFIHYNLLVDASKLTQYDIYSYAGKKRTTFQDYLNLNKSNLPDVISLQNLSIIFGLPIEYFIPNIQEPYNDISRLVGITEVNLHKLEILNAAYDIEAHKVPYNQILNLLITLLGDKSTDILLTLTNYITNCSIDDLITSNNDEDIYYKLPSDYIDAIVKHNLLKQIDLIKNLYTEKNLKKS